MNFRFTKLWRTTVQGLQIAALFSDNVNSTRYYHHLRSYKSLGEYSTGPCQMTIPDICEEAEWGQNTQKKSKEEGSFLPSKKTQLCEENNHQATCEGLQI